jgi:hypothetical protein
VVSDKILGPKVRLMMGGEAYAERAPHESSPPLRAARAAHTTVSPRQRSDGTTRVRTRRTLS